MRKKTSFQIIENLKLLIEAAPYIVDERCVKKTQRFCIDAIDLIERMMESKRRRNRCPFCGNAGIEFKFWLPDGAEYGFYYGFCDECGARIRYKEVDLLNGEDALEENVPGEIQGCGSD